MNPKNYIMNQVKVNIKRIGIMLFNNTLQVKVRSGFTIIELLVVIAIIAVLTSVVFVNVTSYTNKGKNASIKSNLSTILSNSAIYYENYSNYAGFCGTTNYTFPEAAIMSAGGDVICKVNSGNTSFCACSTLFTTNAEPNDSTFCVDSSGVKKLSQTECDTICSTSSATCQ